jgi:Tfp pilus assembly protein PilO
MTMHWRPWRRLIAVWLPAVAVCVLTGSVYVWQISSAADRAARVADEVAEFEADLTRLERIRKEAGDERAAVAELDRQFTILYDDVFGDLDDRLTRILRAVHSATREAGLQPGSFAYTAAEDRKLKYIRFGINFGVDGEYQQLRRLLGALQASSEFLIVENIGISGENEATNRNLSLSIRVATYLAEADKETLRRLTGGIRAPETNEDVADQG